MEQTLLIATAAFYLISLIFELRQRLQFNPKQEKYWLRAEQFAFILFTSGVLIFAYKSQMGMTIYLKKSVGWLFFSWALAGANLLTFYLYENRATGISVKLWAIAAVGALPLVQRNQFMDYFATNLNWLNFHRVVFIVGYAFYFLGLPLALNFLWKDVIRPYFKEAKGAVIEQHLYQLDLLHHKMILWALPLLSLGLLTKIILLLDSEQLVTPFIIWKTSKEEFLAIVTWFTCAFYLHSRIFLRWKYNACVLVYIAGVCIVAFAHYSGRLLLQIT